MTTNKTLLFIPTYNERENISRIYQQIKALDLELDLLFLDDNSPDGTGQILDKISEEDKRSNVIHRSCKLGIGSAHLNAIDWAYQKEYAILITMDCDLTHSPSNIPDFLQYADEVQVVLGSRFMCEESLADWNLFRKFLTFFGHFLTCHCLHVPYDATGAFRLYRLDRINPMIFELVESTGYPFFFESLYIFCLGGIRIKEIPITLPKRTSGQSKMQLKDLVASLYRLITLYLHSYNYKARLRELECLETENLIHT